MSRIAARSLSPTHWQLLLQLQPLGIMLLNGLHMLGCGPYWQSSAAGQVGKVEGVGKLQRAASF